MLPPPPSWVCQIYNRLEEKDGVIIVKNPKEPMYQQDVFQLEEEIIIGEREGSEEYMFSSVSDLAVDSSENIYVLDVRDTQIKVYDKNGTFQRVIGKAGQGPGEFGRPRNIQINSSNELMVNDSGRRKLIFLSLQGQFIRSINLEKLAFRFYCDSKEQYYAFLYILDPPNDSKYQLVKFNADFSNSTIIAENLGQSRFRSESYVFYKPQIVFQLMENDYLLYGYPEEYELQVYSPTGELRKRISRDYIPFLVSKEARDIVSKGSLPGYKAVSSKYYPAYSDFVADDKGKILVRTWEKPLNNIGFIYDVFDSDGRYLTRIQLNFIPQIWERHKLYSIEADEDGYQYVKRYKVTWNY